MPKRIVREGNQIILHTSGEICTTAKELLGSEIFKSVVSQYCETLLRHDSPLLKPLLTLHREGAQWTGAVNLLKMLAENPLKQVAEIFAGTSDLVRRPERRLLHEFVEGLYNFWRSFDRFVVLHSSPGPSSFDTRPYRSFNATVEELIHLIRAVYRDVCENITGNHPWVYRQVSAGCDIGLIAVPRPCSLPPVYEAAISGIPFIRQVWIAPPMIIDPPMNKRTGEFMKAGRNPFEGLALEKEKWLCYPVQVGPLVIFVYFHQKFMGLGCALANLFEMATDEQIAKGPAAVYLYGAPPEVLKKFGDPPGMFYDDLETGMLAAAVSEDDNFGYFGYLKKMILTLHNIAMMKQGRLPFHGAMVHISMKDGREASVAILGDTATGKSETLEAFRQLGQDRIRDLRIIADDMGAFEIGAQGGLRGFGTEIGAFIRLDDLQQGYAFEQIDRAIIMSPQKVNSRVVLPVTELDEVLHGYGVDYLLYANNYEAVDQDHPCLQKLADAGQALEIFRQGAAMAKGTTTSTGLVHGYFANPFGPPQYREIHEKLAVRAFEAAFKGGVYVGQLRTRLGISGLESRGPREAAEALLELIGEKA